MSSNHSTFHGYNPRFPSFSSSQSYSSSSDTPHSLNSNLLPLNSLEENSHSNHSRIEISSIPYQQPILNPHQRFLNRSLSNCPSHLSASKQKKWLKTGQQAQANQYLLDHYERFSWPTSNYDQPIYIHRFTSDLFIQGIMHKISKVHLFTIDTESDKPTAQYPRSVPALIQIQAIYDKQLSTVFLIEVQHLPHRSSYLFALIKALCHQIFSSTNTFMGWGDIRHELRSFEQFDLFNLNQLVTTIDLQKVFTHYWNLTHPHTSECLSQHPQIDDESDHDDVLICFVNSTDLNNDQNSIPHIDDVDNCICLDTNRPYKKKNAVWALQKAIQYIFNQALDKSMTLNIWSCGLDLGLNTWRTSQDKRARETLTNYAIHDVFAVTNLYFHIKDNPVPCQSLSIQLNTIQSNSNEHLSTLLLLTDSHGKYFPPISTSVKYTFTTKAISGLQWFNSHDPDLSVHSLISSSSISSLLTSCFGVILLIGTNSVRTNSAPYIIEQINTIIDALRNKHSHLTRKNRITIISTFPCLKTSMSFPTEHLLMSNIYQYNNMLADLSITKHFTILTIPISTDQLHTDGMHLQTPHIPFIYSFIQQSLDLMLSNSNTARSSEAKKRRNKKRHDKLRQRQAIQHVIRPIAPVWGLHELKSYLKFKHIHYNRLPEIRKHKLYLLFNHSNDQQHAEQTLTQTEFNQQNYYDWISMNH